MFQDNLWFLILNKRRFDQFSEIMKTHIITISVYLHNTIKRRSRGPLSDALVRILIRTTVFSQLCVKVSKLWTQNFEYFWKVTGPHIFSFWLIFDVDSDDLVQISKFNFFRIHRNKVWIGPMPGKGTRYSRTDSRAEVKNFIWIERKPDIELVGGNINCYPPIKDHKHHYWILRSTLATH